MQFALPEQVKEAINRLEQAGYEAYIVGGCVRDTLLGRAPNDWDITTSAMPEETLACFSDHRTIETGIKHGTVTVLLGGMPLEITTYRIDGTYSDNRRPDSVSFSRCIGDDLSRRDFTVNAMAYNPTRGLVDLFDGQAHLADGIIACVGDPTTRFCEDGLRILRALRFSATLDFSIDEPTSDAIHACRDLLSNIAFERIREEFCKLLCGKGAVRILRAYHDVIATFLPEIAPCVGFLQNSRYHCYDVWEHTLHALVENHGSDLMTRLVILLHDIGKPHCYTEDELGGHFKGHGPIGTRMAEDILRRLRFDNDTVGRVTCLVDYHDRAFPAEERAIKRLMQKMSEEDILRLLEVQRCDRLAHAPEHSAPSEENRRIPLIMEEIKRSGACLSLKTLAIKGDDLLALGYPAGKEIGQMLSRLLDAVVEGALPNDRTVLLQYAKDAPIEKQTKGESQHEDSQSNA